MQKLIPALIKAKAEFQPIHKDRTNPHFKHKYATLDAVLDAVTPALGKYGLTVIQTTTITEGKTTLQTHLYHESGESIISTYPLPEISDSQKLGAALTYARRYAVCAILSVTADEEDDGNAALKGDDKKTVVRQQSQVHKNKPPTQMGNLEQDLRVKQIRTLLNYPLDLVLDWLSQQGVKQPSHLHKNKVDQLVRTMCLAWAYDKFTHPEEATDSYHKYVVEAVLRGTDEVTAVQRWMQQVLVPVSQGSQNGVHN
ncbi:MAG: ERF family protein [Desmonostoc vinosum HA7617-LM4]|jgi:hypothetical protein|nr:ERF family protein [Desmonostoc vinosum HA7617-LM4]